MNDRTRNHPRTGDVQEEEGLRAGLIETCLEMNRRGINQGRSGNASVRLPDGLLITPSGIAYDRMRPEDIVFLDRDGQFTGTLQPSSEWRFHHDIIRVRPDVQAVLHAHATFSTALACLGREIPAFHYMVGVAGGANIRCAHYATFGSQELSDHVINALDGRQACLMANHGLITLGASLENALELAQEVETLAKQYWLALQIGPPTLLTPDEMSRVLAKFKTYGQQGSRRSQS